MRDPSEARPHPSLRSRGAAAKIHLALSGLPTLACRPDLETGAIQIGVSLEYLERASDALKYRQMASAPALDIRIPTLETPELAPSGHHVLSPGAGLRGGELALFGRSGSLWVRGRNVSGSRPQRAGT